MLCTFCGTESRPEFKFCGMCGVRLERRQAERRVSPSGASTECTSCGNINEPGLKFCGICGTRVERRVQERRVGESHAGGPRTGGPEDRAVAIANAQLPTPDVAARRKADFVKAAVADREPEDQSQHRVEAAIFRNEHGNGTNISGPSFLGLNAQPGGDGEYLLEDEPSRGGLRKLVLFVIIAAILGLVFVQWRASFKANPKPEPPKAEPASTPLAPQGDNQPVAPGATDQPKQESAAAADSPAAAATASLKEKDVKDKDQADLPPSTVSKVKADTSSAPSETTAAAVAGANKDQKDKKEAAVSASPAKAEAETRVTERKPSAALLRAQQYLQGRGVRQSCEQGLLYLRAATEKNDPGAAKQMAALYSVGHCVKRDRVQAYHWFKSAHELEPENVWLQKDMDQLWAQMTSQERHLAGN